MNRRALMLVITGVVAAIAATVVIYFLITNLTKTPPPPPVTQDTVERRVVVVAATDIAAGTKVTAAQVTTGTYPLEMLRGDTFTSVNDVISKTTNTRIFEGQPLFAQQFSSGADTTSAVIPRGKVLVAFPSTDMLNATGAVQAGDHVDIMLSIPISGTTRLDSGANSGTQLEGGQRTLVAQGTLQNIVVSSVGTWTPPDQQAGNAGANNALKIITFIVDPQEALILKYIKDSGGTIDLAVRSADDNDIKATDPVTLDYLVDLYGFIGLNQPRPSGQAIPAAPTPAATP